MNALMNDHSKLYFFYFLKTVLLANSNELKGNLGVIKESTLSGNTLF